jgi:hypothetical protein
VNSRTAGYVTRISGGVGGALSDGRPYPYKDTLNLVLACGYLSKLLDNSEIMRFLSKHYPDISSEFQQIIEATSL